MGRLNEGIPLLRKALELDPLNLTVRPGSGAPSISQDISIRQSRNSGKP